MRKILFFLFFNYIVWNCMALPFENSRYYFAYEVPGNYFFEFKDGVFEIYIPKTWYDRPGDIGAVLLPGHSDIYAFHFKGKYVLKTDDAGLLHLFVSNQEFLVLYYKDELCFLFHENTTEPSEKNMIDFYKGRNLKYLDEYKNPGIRTYVEDTKFKFSSALQGSTRCGIRYQSPFSWLYYVSVWAFTNQKGGIGEWIEFDYLVKMKRLIIINGFIYLPNTNFYWYNNRIKKIKIECGKSSQIVELDDSPNLQCIDLKFTAESTISKITVLEIYKGARYNDSVISYMGIIF